MDAHTAQVQAAVQQLVMEHGEYAPLELLLATNRLGYDDYRAWREGRLETLDAVLANAKREVRAWLEGAQSWADALGLAAEPEVHHGWENNAGTVLVASADPRLNALLSTRFRHTREHDQLDLFIDSAQTAAVNALVDALAARNASEARRALERLVRIDRGAGGSGSQGTRAGSRTTRTDGTGVGPRRLHSARRPSARFPGAAVARHWPGARPTPLEKEPAQQLRQGPLIRGHRRHSRQSGKPHQ